MLLDMKDMRLAELILRIKIVRRLDDFALSQAHYIDKSLQDLIRMIIN